MKAKQQVLALFPLDKRRGYKCECCGLFVKLYTRKFNSNMALALIQLYKASSHNVFNGYIHLENLLMEKGYKRCGDAAYLRHYRLIEPLKEERLDGSSRNGFYRITGAGIMFVEMKTKVQEKFLIFNNECEGFEGEEIDIKQALKTRFNYNELMGYETELDKTYS